MKKTLKYFMMAATLCCSVSMVSCSSDDDDNSSKPEAAKGTDAAVEAACDQWKTSRQEWEWSEAFLFGPAGDFSIDPHTDTWPFNRTQFDNYMKKYNPSADEDDAEILAEAIATGQNLTGFHAVEYLIFREGAARKIADMTADEVWFAQTAAEDLYLSSLKLVAGWGGDLSDEEAEMLEAEEFEVTDAPAGYDDYGDYFMNGYGAVTGIQQIIAGAQDIIGEVRDSKIGNPATGTDVNYIESPHAYNSIQDFKDNILSCQYALYGGKGNTTPSGTSLIGACLKMSQLKAAAATVQEKLTAAIAAIDPGMKKPFVLYYTDQSAKDAMSALDELDGSLSDLSELIKLYAESDALINAGETICKEYVEKVVRPTYRALATSNGELVEALSKLSY